MYWASLKTKIQQRDFEAARENVEHAFADIKKSKNMDNMLLSPVSRKNERRPGISERNEFEREIVFQTLNNIKERNGKKRSTGFNNM